MSTDTTTATTTTTTTATDAPKRIALIIGSTRNPRVGPHIAQLIHDTIAADASLSGKDTTAPQLELVDLASFNLPLFDEPGIPMMARRADDYAHEHTRAWSRAVSRYAGFVILTPQYNRSVPAALKNAMDFLFHEFAGKPCLILSYGGRGGAGAAAHLADIVHGFRMRNVGGSVAFALGQHPGAQEAAGAGTLWEGAPVAWAEELERTKALYAELCKQL